MASSDEKFIYFNQVDHCSDCLLLLFRRAPGVATLRPHPSSGPADHLLPQGEKGLMGDDWHPDQLVGASGFRKQAPFTHLLYARAANAITETDRALCRF